MAGTTLPRIPRHTRGPVRTWSLACLGNEEIGAIGGARLPILKVGFAAKSAAHVAEPNAMQTVTPRVKFLTGYLRISRRRILGAFGALDAETFSLSRAPCLLITLASTAANSSAPAIVGIPRWCRPIVACQHSVIRGPSRLGRT